MASLFVKNCGEERETSKRASLWVLDTRTTSGSRSRHRCLHVTLTFMSYTFALCLRSFPRWDCSLPRWCDNENKSWALIYSWAGFMGTWDSTLSPPRPFSWIDFFQAINHWLLASKYSLDLFERSLYKQRLSHSPLQKRETERENGCFPFVWKSPKFESLHQE